MLYQAKEQKLTLPNGQMDYITFGRGSKALVMIQGLNTRGIHGSAAALAWMYRCFAKDYTVYLFDRRENLPGGVTVRELAADTAAAMDALGLTAADILGVSLGGMMAQYLAIDRPDLVSRMVLAVTAARNHPTVESVIARWIDLTERGEIKALVVDMAEKMYSERYLRRYRPLLPLLAVLQKPKDVPRFVNLAGACLTCDTYAELDKVRCPVLVIGGGQDKIVGADASRELAEKLHCPAHIYEDLGHAAYEEAKDFNERVYAFLRG